MKSVVVTGGTVRLGKAIADRLFEDGWHVIRASHRGDSGADIIADLSSEDGPRVLVEKAREILGGRMPDALVNNASVFSPGDEDHLQVNFLSPAGLVALMATSPSPTAVVNILDNRILNRPPETPYEKAKAKLRDFTVDAAREYCGKVRVNAVAPGPVLVPVSVSEKAGKTPFGRPSPEDVAEAVSFLLSAKSTSGCIMPVDGGQWLL